MISAHARHILQTTTSSKIRMRHHQNRPPVAQSLNDLLLLGRVLVERKIKIGRPIQTHHQQMRFEWIVPAFVNRHVQRCFVQRPIAYLMVIGQGRQMITS